MIRLCAADLARKADEPARSVSAGGARRFERPEVGTNVRSAVSVARSSGNSTPRLR